MTTELNTNDKGRRSIPAQLLDELEKAGVEVFLNQQEQPHATIPRKGHKETWPLESRGFNDFVVALGRRSLGVPIVRHAIEVVRDQLRATSAHEGERQNTYIRVAAIGERIYLDLTDADWRAVEIDQDGWRVVSNPPVKFVRAPRSNVLPMLERGGDISLLKDLIPFRSEDDFTLTVAFLLSALKQKGPHLAATIIGKKGTGKTATCRILKNLIDPSETIETGVPRTEQDLWIRAQNQHVLFFGNLRRLNAHMSDALARLLTGGGHLKRELYTNSDLCVLEAERPLLLNSIYNVIEQPDLADRCFFLELAGFDNGRAKRLAREQLDRRFEELAPLILSALCDGVSGALRRRSATLSVPDTRMVDALAFAIAAEPSLGFSDGTIAGAYKRHLARIRERLLESHPVVDAVLRLIATGGSWRGTWFELQSDLKGIVGDASRSPDWPRTTHQLSGVIRGSEDLLFEEGVVFKPYRDGSKTNHRCISLSRIGDSDPASDSVDPRSEVSDVER
jgi:hypothetical protein